VVKRIEAAGGKACALATDVTSEAQCAALVDEAVRRYGWVYAAYANAGYGEERSMEEMGDDRLRAIFETNFFGTMNLIRPAAAAMKKNPRGKDGERGHILICSSCLAKFAVPFFGAYSATKSAQAHVGRAMRYELGPEGVQVSTVHPIGTRTELFDKMAEISGPSKLGANTPEHLSQSSEFVAECTVRCLHRPRAEVWTGAIGGLVRVGMSLGTMMPNLSDWALRNMLARKMRAARK